jgi:hypothetical protein
VPDGVAASEYDFLRFRINANNREFRVLTGGVFHSTGADRNQVFFKPVKTAARTYEFTVDKRHRRRRIRDLAAGYGQPHQRRQIYTFAIVE